MHVTLPPYRMICPAGSPSVAAELLGPTRRGSRVVSFFLFLFALHARHDFTPIRHPSHGPIRKRNCPAASWPDPDLPVSPFPSLTTSSTAKRKIASYHPTHTAKTSPECVCFPFCFFFLLLVSLLPPYRGIKHVHCFFFTVITMVIIIFTLTASVTVVNNK